MELTVFVGSVVVFGAAAYFAFAVADYFRNRSR